MRTHHVGLAGCSILQTADYKSPQKMGYILTTPNGELIVIDGGFSQESDRLRGFLRERGGRVALWLMTHCHCDHIEAPSDILCDPQDIIVERACYAFPSHEWLSAIDPQGEDTYDRAERMTAALGERWIPAQKGLTLSVGGVQIECLSDPLYLVGREPTGRHYSINDTSAVFRVTFPNGKIALFLGDCGAWQGEVLLAEHGAALKADLCQMAHHGQDGAEKPVYEAILPDFCFYDAPLWLWDNDIGGGFDSGPFHTIETRRWMASLGCIRYSVIVDGDNLVI